MCENTRKPDIEFDHAALGFRKPSDDVTLPCLTYMHRIMELRDFIGFVFSFVKTSVDLGRLIPNDAKKNAVERERVVLEYNFSRHRRLVNQVMLSRAVESFDLYLTTILRDIFLSKPEMLKSEQQLDATTIIEAGSYDEVLLKLVERKVHELGYKPLLNLRKYVSKGTGIDLFANDEMYEAVLVASEVRNLIAHNNCIVNALFKARTAGVKVELERSQNGELQVSDEWLRRASYTLDAAVFRFDELAAAKFGLETLSRKEHGMADPST